MEEEPIFKVLWLSKTSKLLKSFVFTSYNDDPQNGRCLFIDDEDTDKVLTLYYDDLAYLITSVYEPYKAD
jgi:hypothetical protein